MNPDKIEQIEKMRMGVDYSFTVQLRGFDVRLRPLARSEMVKCYQNVAAYLQTIPAHRRTKIDEDNALAGEFLKLASCEYGEAVGQITEPILNQMTNDEIMFLYKEWLAICDKVNPQLEEMKSEDLQKLVEHIKKNTPEDLAFQLTELSFGQIRSLVTYLLTNGD